MARGQGPVCGARRRGECVPLLLKSANLRPAPALLWPAAVRHVDADSETWELGLEEATLRRMMATGDVSGVRRFLCGAQLEAAERRRVQRLAQAAQGESVDARYLGLEEKMAVEADATNAVFSLWASVTSARRRATALDGLALMYRSVSRPFGVWASFAAGARRRGLRRAVPIVDIYTTGLCRPSSGVLGFLVSTTSAPASALASPTPPPPLRLDLAAPT